MENTLGFGWHLKKEMDGANLFGTDSFYANNVESTPILPNCKLNFSEKNRLPKFRPGYAYMVRISTFAA